MHRSAARRALRLVALAIIVLPCEAISQRSPRDLAVAAQRSVVTIVGLDQSGRALTQGSGFAISAEGDIATNYHVIEGATVVEVTLPSGHSTFDVMLLITDPVRDLAVLRVPNAGLPRMALRQNFGATGDRIYVVGSPLGLQGTFSEGLISGVRTTQGQEYLQITAPISPGSSGGPVIDSDGSVIGVATATLSEGQNLNFAVPARYLRGLLAMGGRPQPFSDRLVPRVYGAPSSRWTRPASPYGSYLFVSDSTGAAQDRIGGYAVVLPDGPAERLVGYWSYSATRRDLPIDQIINWFSTPFQVSSNGAVEVDLWQPLRGGFVRGGDLELNSIPGSIPGGGPSMTDRVVFEPLDGQGNVDRFMGGFRVTGFSGHISWEGVIGLVTTPYLGPEGYVCAVVLVIRSVESGEVRVSQQCSVDVSTGQIHIDPFRDRGTRFTAWGSIRSGVLEFTLNRQVTSDLYQSIDLRGVRY